MCAADRSILVIVSGTSWLIPRPGSPTSPPGWHDEQAGRDRRIRSHLRQLKALGIDVTVNPAAA